MKLRLSDDQKMIRDEAARFLAQMLPAGSIRSFVEGGESHNAALWGQITQDLGWTALAIAEDRGGLGLGRTEQVILCESLGHRLAPLPYWSTSCLAAPVLEQLDTAPARALLEQIASGTCAVSLALADPAAFALCAPQVVAMQEADGYRLSGEVAMVADLPAVDILLLPALLDGNVALFALDRGHGDWQAIPALDATRPMGRLVLEGITVAQEARIDTAGLSDAQVELALDQARLCLAAEQIGAAAALLEMTLAYLEGRVQFGRKLSSFQSLKHRCALIQVSLSEARSMAYGVAAAFGAQSSDHMRMEILALKAMADRLALHAAREAIQLHGGVAMTWEYDPHFWMKRIQTNAVLLGQADQHLDRIAEHLLNGDGAWS